MKKQAMTHWALLPQCWDELRKSIIEQLANALDNENFVISESSRKDLMPTARIFFDSEDGSVDLSVGYPPGNAYVPGASEFHYALGTIDPGDADGTDDNVASWSYIDENIEMWTDEIYYKCLERIEKI